MLAVEPLSTGLRDSLRTETKKDRLLSSARLVRGEAQEFQALTGGDAFRGTTYPRYLGDARVGSDHPAMVGEEGSGGFGPPCHGGRGGLGPAGPPGQGADSRARSAASTLRGWLEVLSPAATTWPGCQN